MITIPKEWGAEYLIEVNPDYTMKNIVVDMGCALPSHYHELKKETFYILDGQGMMIIDGKERHVTPGDFVTILPGQVHSLIPEDGFISFIEASTSFLTDSIREVEYNVYC